MYGHSVYYLHEIIPERVNGLRRWDRREGGREGMLL
jgi:hypothetical protein